MDDRYEDIADAHGVTFQWIYERPELGFVDWLKAGKGVYWITGKAGSGKSTLMKLILKDPRTQQNLPRDTENTVVAGFFFHDRGQNALLKSHQGLFRAILHSILSKYPQLIPVTLRRRWAVIGEDIASGSPHARRQAWTIAELRRGFLALASQKELRARICLVIDGLDEFSGEHREIVDTLAELLPTSDDCWTHVQLCVSSRPLVIFEAAYQKHKHLEVHWLSKNDIQAYVVAKFRDVPELSELLEEDSSTTENIIQEILRKAEGVSMAACRCSKFTKHYMLMLASR